jgi:hypothetical protein
VRLWTVHPRYLDSRGLVALWRESLLAQKVLQGETRGYRSHPQLLRFRAQPEPLSAIAAYLHGVRDEALRRGYAFDGAKIGRAAAAPRLQETEGQLRFEWLHLLEKLARRSPTLYAQHRKIERPEAHPVFEIIPGPPAAWERNAAPAADWCPKP